MLSNDPFGFDLIKKYMAVFGSLFNGITLTRSINGEQTQAIAIPLSYSNKEKMLLRNTEDPDLNRQAAITLPRMSYEVISMGYDGDRKTTGIRQRSVVSQDPNVFNTQYAPVPYNFLMNLHIYVKNMSDGTRIVEQILPFFQPDYTVTCNLIPEMDVNVDIPIILNGIRLDNTTSDSFTERQIIIWSLNFTLKGFLYCPIKPKKIIKFADTNTYADLESSKEILRLRVQPGLTVSGNPTNSLIDTVDALTIDVNDNFGFIETIGM